MNGKKGGADGGAVDFLFQGDGELAHHISVEQRTFRGESGGHFHEFFEIELMIWEVADGGSDAGTCIRNLMECLMLALMRRDDAGEDVRMPHGFSSLSNFYRVFREQTGRMPMELRRGVPRRE